MYTVMSQQLQQTVFTAWKDSA